MKGAADIVEAFGSTAGCLGRGFPDTVKELGKLELMAGSLAKDFPGENLGLIEAALAVSGGGEGDGDENAVGEDGVKLWIGKENADEVWNDPEPSLILELVDEMAGDRVEDDSGSRAENSGRRSAISTVFADLP